MLIKDWLKEFTEIAKEWHPTENGRLSPFDVKRAYNKKVWWVFSEGMNGKPPLFDVSI
ncbi:zinc-ribbon domain-containing protein [Lysinibacillus sp. NPDC056959]|uniref:zinc-ribbon domain-containing protein n=1 Tax=Lysinibacillus sp. NPDC056959 TaxID=3345981 RepID=UPI00362E787A